MGILKKKKTESEKIKKIEDIKKATGDDIKETKSKAIKKGSKVIANGRCFGASSLQCPLKTVRDYETKILDIDKKYNSVLIDEGWISKNNIR